MSEKVSAYITHAPIFIDGNGDFTGSNGVTGGSGIALDPYIIDGWEIDASTTYGINIINTDAHFIVRDSYIHSGSTTNDGIRFYNVQNGNIEDVISEDNRYGIVVSNTNNILIFNNTVTSSNWYGIYITESIDDTVENNNVSLSIEYGISLYNSDNNFIINNTVTSSGENGIYTTGSNGNTISNNTVFSNSNNGIVTDSSNDNTIANNSVSSHNWYGIHIYQCNGTTVFSNNASDNNYGIYLYELGGHAVVNNTVLSNSVYGIVIYFSSANLVVGNHVSNNQFGIDVGTSIDNLIYHNNIINNQFQALDNTAGGNQWDNGYPSGGNYWSDYSGVDFNSTPSQNVPPPDGIGDTPYYIDTDSMDNYPLIRPWDDNAPAISDVAAAPDPQHAGGNVNISAVVTDNYLLSEVWVGIIDPNADFVNLSMLYDSINGRYYLNQTYTIPGVYIFTIWANDVSDNFASISDSFTIQDTAPPTIDDVTTIPNPQEVFHFVNVSANVTDDQQLYRVRLSIYDPDVNFLGNFTMLYDPINGRYYWNQTYNVIGTYIFTIWANDTYNKWDSSSGSFVMATVPDAPTGLTVNAGDSCLNISWSAPSSDGGSPIIGYNIYRNGTAEVYETVFVSQLWYNDTDVFNGITYTYNVSAKNDIGEGPKSVGVSGVPMSFPSAPQNLEASSGNGFVNLTWEAPASNGGSEITNYRIYRGEASGGEEFLAEIGSLLFYNDTTVSNGVTYYYKVSAKNFDGEGQLSNEISATPATVPSTPQNLQATAGTGFVNLSWEAPSSDGGSPISNYMIYKGTTSNGEALLVEIGIIRFYNDSDVTNGVKYYYKVSAKNALGEGPLSNEANATPSIPGNQPPTCNILYPTSGATISGTIEINGTASDADGSVQRIELKIDNGNWIIIPGAASWSYNLDTTEFSNGPHTIHIRSYDGTDYSSQTSVSVELDNPVTEEEEDMWWLWLLIVLIIVILVIVVLMVLRRKKPLEEEEEEEEFEEEVPPPPPKKAKVTELFGEGEEEGEEEMDKLDFPEADEEL